MEMTVTLIVCHKDIDLVASTAFLALTGKMGYEGTLAGLRRFDYFRFTLELTQADGQDRAFEALEQALSLQSTFYNRNKHNYLLDCTSNGWHKTGGIDLKKIEAQLAGEVSARLEGRAAKNCGGQTGSKEVIFNKDRIFLAEVLVEEIDPHTLDSLSHKLTGSGGWRGVRFLNRGVLWWLVLGASSLDRAKRVVEEVVVSVTRDRGLLLNPNYQRYEVLALRNLVME